MVSFSAAAISAATLLALVQYCPAPFLAIPVVVSVELGSTAAWVGAIGGITGGIAGAVNAANAAKKDKRDVFVGDFNSRIKRQDDFGGTKLAWQLCHDQLQQATVGFQAAGPGNLLITGLPPACMTLSTVITGKFNEGNPVPMGTDSIQFNNLSNDSLDEIKQALQARS